MTGVIGWIIVGIVAGWLAGVITKTDRSIWGDLILGLIGAFIGGIIIRVIFGDSNNGIIGSIIVATIGAVILVMVKNMMTGRRAL